MNENTTEPTKANTGMEFDSSANRRGFVLNTEAASAPALVKMRPSSVEADVLDVVESACNRRRLSEPIMSSEVNSPPHNSVMSVQVTVTLLLVYALTAQPHSL